jgi:DNA-directed RNA polymerase subunit RPC12/RpoP
MIDTRFPNSAWYMVLMEIPKGSYSALVLVDSEADAKAGFREIYPEVEVTDEQLEVHLATECPKCHYMNHKQSTIRDSWNVDLYTCYVCENCGEQYGGDLDHA